MKIVDQSTIEYYEQKMRDLQMNPEIDQEDSHILADAYLCDILKEAGLTKLVELYDVLPKWYA